MQIGDPLNFYPKMDTETSMVLVQNSGNLVEGVPGSPGIAPLQKAWDRRSNLLAYPYSAELSHISKYLHDSGLNRTQDLPRVGRRVP
jgi:hypothetical protein